MSNISLYELSSEVERLLSSDDAFDPDTGELSEALVAALDATKGKAINVAAFILNMREGIDAMGAHIARINDRREIAVQRMAKLSEYLRDNMKRTGIHEVKADDGTFTAKLYIERDASVDIFDEKQIPQEYMTKPKPPKPAPSKTEIRKALDAGKDVPGARVVKKDRLELR